MLVNEDLKSDLPQVIKSPKNAKLSPALLKYLMSYNLYYVNYTILNKPTQPHLSYIHICLSKASVDNSLLIAFVPTNTA